MDHLKKKYIMLYLKRNAILALGIALPISFLFLVVAIIYDAVPFYDKIAGVLFPIICSFFGFAASSLYVFRFLWLIEKQEKLLNITFCDDGAMPLNKSITFLSKDWLIHSGSCAFHRKFIKSFSQHKHYGIRVANGYKITVNTVDGHKRCFWTMGSRDIDEYRKWREEQT